MAFKFTDAGMIDTEIQKLDKLGTASRCRSIAKSCAYGDKQAVEKILESVGPLQINKPLKLDSPPYKWTGLIFACRNLNEDAVCTLLNRGANPKIQANGGFTPIMAVAVASSVKNQDRCVTCAKMLVKAGTSISETPLFNGRTLLTRAVLKQAKDLVLYFLTVGADPNEIDERGEMALNIAVSQNMKDIAECLIANGANPFLNNKNNENCLDLALTANGIPATGEDMDMGAMVVLWRMDYFEERCNGNKRQMRNMVKRLNQGCSGNKDSKKLQITIREKTTAIGNSIQSNVVNTHTQKIKDKATLTNVILSEPPLENVSRSDLEDTLAGVGVPFVFVGEVEEQPNIFRTVSSVSSGTNSEQESRLDDLISSSEHGYDDSTPPASPTEDMHKNGSSNTIPSWVIVGSAVLVIAGFGCFRRMVTAISE